MKLFHTSRRNQQPCSDYGELTVQAEKNHFCDDYLQDLMKCFLLGHSQ